MDLAYLSKLTYTGSATMRRIVGISNVLDIVTTDGGGREYKLSKTELADIFDYSRAPGGNRCIAESGLSVTVVWNRDVNAVGINISYTGIIDPQVSDTNHSSTRGFDTVKTIELRKVLMMAAVCVCPVTFARAAPSTLNIYLRAIEGRRQYVRLSWIGKLFPNIDRAEIRAEGFVDIKLEATPDSSQFWSAVALCIGVPRDGSSGKLRIKGGELLKVVRVNAFGIPKQCLAQFSDYQLCGNRIRTIRSLYDPDRYRVDVKAIHRRNLKNAPASGRFVDADDPIAESHRAFVQAQILRREERQVEMDMRMNLGFSSDQARNLTALIRSNVNAL